MPVPIALPERSRHKAEILAIVKVLLDEAEPKTAVPLTWKPLTVAESSRWWEA